MTIFTVTHIYNIDFMIDTTFYLLNDKNWLHLKNKQMDDEQLELGMELFPLLIDDYHQH